LVGVDWFNHLLYVEIASDGVMLNCGRGIVQSRPKKLRSSDPFWGIIIFGNPDPAETPAEKKLLFENPASVQKTQ
jgi:hypothetical protein